MPGIALGDIEALHPVGDVDDHAPDARQDAADMRHVVVVGETVPEVSGRDVDPALIEGNEACPVACRYRPSVP